MAQKAAEGGQSLGLKSMGSVDVTFCSSIQGSSRRYKGADIAKKCGEPIFDFLIQEFFITIILLSKKKFDHKITKLKIGPI